MPWSGITDLIARIVDSLYTGMNYDDIKDSNRRDCESKKMREGTTESKTLQKQRATQVSASVGNEQSSTLTRTLPKKPTIKHEGENNV